MTELQSSEPSLGQGVRIVPASQAKVRFIDAEPSVEVDYNINEDGTINIDILAPIYTVWIQRVDYSPRVIATVFKETDAREMTIALKQNIRADIKHEYAVGSDRQAIVDYTKSMIQVSPAELAKIIKISEDFKTSEKARVTEKLSLTKEIINLTVDRDVLLEQIYELQSQIKKEKKPPVTRTRSQRK